MEDENDLTWSDNFETVYKPDKGYDGFEDEYGAFSTFLQHSKPRHTSLTINELDTLSIVCSYDIHTTVLRYALSSTRVSIDL
ncbi:MULTISPECIES: hypothetical protein [Gammaproteobacteria]|uniref:hypothetical protein n=1 Tax=Gammaproteobacteria TaxID=1236 RepID=UPI0003BF9A24|nr:MULTISPECIES: hypothetical protein [Gammaproteobacteria]EHN8840742.1 hypothetical protein [Enterobacter hormaechei]ELC6457814.1 hypothetical protein [Enterobacter hormaechei]ELC6476297.1 hypothetical protein [Enterobacter hormaechei]ELD7988163.1 hypothetical protein [Enterobacter hormaechei]ELV3435663.1 hypothetical protein [Enterobacter hormaechei]